MKKLLALLCLCLAPALFADYVSDNFYSIPSLNTVFQPDSAASSDNLLTYSVQIVTHLTISGGESATVYLEQSYDNSTWTEVSHISSSLSGTLVIGVAITDTKTIILSGVVQDQYYVRIRTATSGSPTITIVRGVENSLG